METPSPKTTPPLSHEESLSDVVTIMATLRGPDGCPWDREQTTESLKPYLLEEVYEVLEAIDAKDPLALKEELGDLLLQILFHSQIASEQGQFSYQDVKKDLGDKLIRRHPHVFHHQGNTTPLTSGEVLRQWDQLKQQEKGQNQNMPSVLANIPKTSPALLRAAQVQKRAARVGFDWSTIEPVLQKFKEELDELYAEMANIVDSSDDLQDALTTTKTNPDIEAEFGDVLFSMVNVSRFLHINPEEALRKATNKFIMRFHYVELEATRHGQNLKDYPPEKLDHWWKAAKRQETNSSHLTETTHEPLP